MISARAADADSGGKAPVTTAIITAFKIPLRPQLLSTVLATVPGFPTPLLVIVVFVLKGDSVWIVLEAPSLS